MNPCKEVSGCSVYKQLDSIAEQVTAELLQSHSRQDRETTLPVRDSDTSVHSSGGEDRAGTSKLRRMELPTEVILDGINTVLYKRLHFSAPSRDQYYNLENSFIDRVSELVFWTSTPAENMVPDACTQVMTHFFAMLAIVLS